MSEPMPEAGGRVTVSCPGCDEKYVIEAAAVPPWGGKLPCRICGGGISIPGRSAESSSPANAGASSEEAAALDAKLKRAGTAAAAETNDLRACQSPVEPLNGNDGATSTGGNDPSAYESAESPNGPPEVTCPRCHHSFRLGPLTLATKTILIVEDTEFFLHLAKETLGQRYRVLAARTKVEALRLLREESVDLVILDLALEGEDDGSGVLSGTAPKGIPCLIFTARSEAEMWGEAWNRLHDMGASDLLLKGMNVEEQLLSKVAALLPS